MSIDIEQIAISMYNAYRQDKRLFSFLLGSSGFNFRVVQMRNLEVCYESEIWEKFYHLNIAYYGEFGRNCRGYAI